MKRFLLALAAVVALTVGSSFTSTAMADGGHHGHHGYGHHEYHGGYHGGYHHRDHCGPSYDYGGGYERGYSSYRPSYGYGRGYDGYADPCFGGYGRSSHGVIQIYGPRGGFSFGF